MKKIYYKFIRKNLGLLNLSGKVVGRILFLILTSIFAFKLSVNDFAAFAIFWTTYKMFTFFCSNNLYIVYFNEARENLMVKKSWPEKISFNIIFTALVFSLLAFFACCFIFESFLVSVIFIPLLVLTVIIRNISEFSKSNDSVLLSIFLEDFLFYVFLFFFGLVSVFFLEDFISIVIAVFLSVVLTSIFSIHLFQKKFQVNFKIAKINWKLFSMVDFKSGITYTILRGSEFISSFGVRYFGQIYFGDIFVAYTHVMYQFYNLFALISISIISGLQSKITIKKDEYFNIFFIKKIYFKIIKISGPIMVTIIIGIMIFNSKILNTFFPKYSDYNILLLKVTLTSILFMIFQPLVYIFIYNNKLLKIRILNIIQYISIAIIFFLPFFFENINKEFWLILVMSCFIIIQGIFSLFSLKEI